MNCTQPQVSNNSLASSDRAIRIGFCVFTLLFSYFALRFAMSIAGFEAIFADMLGGKPLPELTQFILKTGYIWILLSAICAILPFVFAFATVKTSTAIYGISVAAVIQVFQIVLLWTALTAPLVSIISGMSGGL